MSRPVSLLMAAIVAVLVLFPSPAAVRVTASAQAIPRADPDRDRRIKWWREARFGMFIHWGLYAVPAGEYKGKRAKDIGEWIMSWANIPRREYEQFAPQFNPVK